MPFYINHSDGTSLATVPDGAVDTTSTSITLLGKNFPTYGQFLNQNLVTMLENSASSTSPNNPLMGQLWYDSTNKNISFYREGSTANKWQKLAMTSEGAVAPVDPRLGDLWWDSNTSQLKLYDTVDKAWRVIGPQTTSNGQLRVTGNNIFNLQVGGNTVLTLDNYGGMNLQYNPCVGGYGNDSEVAEFSTAGITNYQRWKPIVTIDNGSNMDDGVFVVNTPGIYEVYAHVTTISGLSDGETRLRWYLNYADTGINATSNFFDATIISVNQLVCSGFIKAIAGDNIELVCSTANDTNVRISNENSSYSIRLVG